MPSECVSHSAAAGAAAAAAAEPTTNGPQHTLDDEMPCHVITGCCHDSAVAESVLVRLLTTWQQRTADAYWLPARSFVGN